MGICRYGDGYTTDSLPDPFSSLSKVYFNKILVKPTGRIIGRGQPFLTTDTYDESSDDSSQWKHPYLSKLSTILCLQLVNAYVLTRLFV